MFFSKKPKEPIQERPERTPVITNDLEQIESKNELNVGLNIVHKTLGKGIIKDVDTNTVKIDFAEYEPKDLLIDICINKQLLFHEGNNE